MPCIAYLALPVVARFLCGGRKGTFAYRVGQLSILALGLGSLGASFYLFQIGENARWRSDGPGMLGVILIMLALAGCALVFGAMFIGTLTRDDSDEEDKIALLRAALAALIVLSVVVAAVRVWWRLR
jgi:hypothetical protein